MRHTHTLLVSYFFYLDLTRHINYLKKKKTTTAGKITHTHTHTHTNIGKPFYCPTLTANIETNRGEDYTVMTHRLGEPSCCRELQSKHSTKSLQTLQCHDKHTHTHTHLVSHHAVLSFRANIETNHTHTRTW